VHDGENKRMIIDFIIDWWLRNIKLRDQARYDTNAVNYIRYDEQNPQTNLDIKKGIEKLVFEKNPALVLDVGCGSGRYFPFLKGEMIVGVDLSTRMLKCGRKFKHINLIQADIFNLPFKENIFDLIISMSIIGENCPLTMKLLKEISYTLGSKGMFAFTVIPLHHRLLPIKGYVQFFLPLQIIKLMHGNEDVVLFWASKLEIKNKLRKLGLEIIQIRERHGIIYPHFLIVSISNLKELPHA
jgi:SAM-dependent methyltransferase